MLLWGIDKLLDKCQKLFVKTYGLLTCPIMIQQHIGLVFFGLCFCFFAFSSWIVFEGEKISHMRSCVFCPGSPCVYFIVLLIYLQVSVSRLFFSESSCFSSESKEPIFINLWLSVSDQNLCHFQTFSVWKQLSTTHSSFTTQYYSAMR